MQPKSSRLMLRSSTCGVVAEMRIAVDHRVVVERHVPGAEHVVGDPVALLERCVLELEQWSAVQPAHGEQAPGRELAQHLGHVHLGFVPQHVRIKAHVPGLAPVIELLAQALGQLLVDPLRIDRAVVAPVDAEDQPELRQIRLDCALDARILQLARQQPAVMGGGAMDLAERSGGRGLELEMLEAGLPVGAQLGGHAPAHERATHRRRRRLQLGELGRVLLGQRLGYGCQQLRDLHQRAFQAAEREAQLFRVLRLIDVEAQKAGAGEACRQPAHGPRDLGIAANPAGERVLRAAHGTVGHGQLASSASNRSIMPSMIARPLAQNSGSVASSPNGASSSLCRRVPPARSSSR